MVEIFLYRVIEVRHLTGNRFIYYSFFIKGFFDVHILKGPPGLFSNPEVKLERVSGVVTWETSGEMCMASNPLPLLLGYNFRMFGE